MNAQATSPDLRPNILKVVHAVIQAAGQDAMDAFNGTQHFSMKVENGPWQPLVIEAWNTPDALGTDEKRRVVVGHYVTESGDRISDPELEMNEYGYPIRLELKLGATTVMFRNDAGQVMIRPRAKREVDSFSRTWAANIRQQGFIQAAKKAGRGCWKVS